MHIVLGIIWENTGIQNKEMSRKRGTADLLGTLVAFDVRNTHTALLLKHIYILFILTSGEGHDNL